LESQPTILVLAGPNGAGKSTAASVLIPAGIPFLNADEIAKALPGYPSRSADILAGRRLIDRMTLLEEARGSFAVETTLASRSLAPRIRRLQRSGYRFELAFLWTPSPEFSIRRVAERVRLGGHSIPQETIRRRYSRGLTNLFRSYIPIADLWKVYDNTDLEGPNLVAEGCASTVRAIVDPAIWDLIRERESDASKPAGS
jgi:predicted ABC-type ATPase